MNTRRWVLAAVAIAALAGAGYYAYTTYAGRPGAAQQAQRQRDAGLGVLLAIRTLERDSDTRLSREQIGRVLPFVKALKDVPTSDIEASLAIARAVRDIFTPQQQAALDAARREFQRRGATGTLDAGPGDAAGEGAGSRDGAGARGAGRAPGGAGGITEEQRAEFRTRTFERMIRYLERRMES
jgi:hypothetical protein